MVGKLTTVLTKKEAEAYSAQGLHQEALKLYKNLLSSTPNLDDAFKGMIHDQMASLNQELDDGHPGEGRMLSAVEIRRIRKGWGTNATDGDILVCAQAFCQVGHYKDAFLEVVKLLQKGCAMGNAVGLFADCLAHLYRPKQLRQGLDRLGKKIFSKARDRLRLYLLTAEAMVNLKQPLHAYVLYRYLKQQPGINPKAHRYLLSIAKGIKQLQAAQKAEDNVAPAQPSVESSPKEARDKSPSNWLSVIKKLFSKKKS